MKRTILIGAICAILGSGLSALSIGEDATNAEFWNAERRNVPDAPRMAAGASKISPSRQEAARLVAYEARSQLGEQWVPFVLRTGQIESRFQCGARGPKTRYGKAAGVLQVLPSTAEMIEPGSSRHLLDCATGARVGVAYMKHCISNGATTESLLSRCFVGGVRAITARLGRGKSGERYATSYVGLVAKAPLTQFAENGGWLSRNSVSIFR